MAIHDLDDRPAAAQNNAAIESDMEISDNSDAELEQQVSLLAQQSSASAPPPPKPSAPTPTQVPTQAQAQAPSSFNIVKDEIPVDDWVMGRKPLFSRPPKSLIINVANDNPADNKIIEDIYGPFPEVSFPTYQSGAMKDTEEMARALLELKQRIARAEELRRQSASPVTPVATLATTPPAKSTPVESSSLASPALKKPITADSSSSKPIVKPITPPNTSSNLVVQTSPDTSAPTAKISLPTKPARPQEPLKEVTKELPKQPEKMIVDPVTEPVKASSTDVPMKERMNEPVKTAIDVPVKESVNEPVKTSIDVPMKEAIVEAVKEPIKESTKQVTELGTQSLPTKPITPSAKSVNLSTKPSTTEPSTSTRRPSIKEATLNALQNLIEINESKLKASSLISASRAPVPFTSFSASALIAPPPREPESLAKVPTSPLVKPSVSAPLSELPPAEPHVQNTDDMNVEESDDSNEYYGTPPSSPIREEPTEEEIVADIKRMIASIDQQKKAIEEAEERKKEINLKILKAEVLLSIERNRQKSRAMEDPVVGKKRPLDPETSLEQQIKRLKEDDELSDMDIADDVSVGSSSSPSAPNYGVPASSSAPTSTATTTSAPPRSAPISSSSIPASSIARPHVSASIPPIPFNQALSSHSSASPHTIPLPSIPSSNLPPMHHGRGTIPTAGNSSFPSGLSHSSTSSSTYPVPQMPLATLSMPPPVQPTVSKPTVSQPTAVKSTVKSTASAKPSAAESITGKRQSPMVKPKSARVVPLADGLQLTTYMTELEALVKFRLSEQKPTTDNQNVVRPPPRPARLVIVDGFTLTMDSVLLNRDHGKPKEMPNTPGAGSTDPTSAITSTDDEVNNEINESGSCDMISCYSLGAMGIETVI
ncbi:uncharacterized protein BYT42DRAFT_320792 [Radiomyces spectabilis]|uniref:uncharacterized protein n=1 Tax=Radiomyces spectabilis TaxID=64574 RepID=UPI00221F7425|nr:uncharacterized protein BYT42DRAFT_320792 [Radiomyces spectabilis]KAI8379263.1 hypothetical protein BYT42DRAFT_320792 [Radiomyces spectabilis]